MRIRRILTARALAARGPSAIGQERGVRSMVRWTFLAVPLMLVPLSGSAAPVNASCHTGATFVVATGSATLGGAMCSIQIECAVAPCTMEMTLSIGGAGYLGGRMFVSESISGQSRSESCGPGLKGCIMRIGWLSSGGPVTITCDASAAPGVAAAVDLYCGGTVL